MQKDLFSAQGLKIHNTTIFGNNFGSKEEESNFYSFSAFLQIIRKISTTKINFLTEATRKLMAILLL
jgi:hypothetical protein